MSTNSEQAERRRNERLHRRESVSVQIVLPDSQGDSRSQVLETVTVDISREGIRLLMAAPLEQNRILDLCIEIEGQSRRFLLIGETCWCRYSDLEQMHEVGLQIMDGDGTDYPAWSEHFSG